MKNDEIESLNLDELDVEELEQRLELAAATPLMQCTELVVCSPDSGGGGGSGGGGW